MTEMNSKRSDTRASYPMAVLVVMVGLIANVILKVADFVPFSVDVMRSSDAPSAWLVFALLISIIGGFVPTGVAVWAIARRYRWAPIAATIASIWVTSSLLGELDILTAVSIAVALVTVIAVWHSSTRQFLRGVGHGDQLETTQ
jgi:hypothetical protein